jgi:hypothetical protein
MSDVLTKIKLSFAFLISIPIHCILFLYYKNNKKEIRWWDSTIYKIRTEYERDKFTLIGHSLFPIMVIFIIYIILHCLHFSTVFEKPVEFFSILLAIGALLISIIIAMELKKKKVENTFEFIEQLITHIDYLKHISLKKNEKHNLYIITPNINIGIGFGYSIADIIEKNKNIYFKFICKTIEFNVLDGYQRGKCIKRDMQDFLNNVDEIKNKMLYYLNEWYDDKLESSIEELEKILKIAKNRNSNVEIIEKYDEIYLERKVGGYLSDKECLLGMYIWNEEQNEKKVEERKLLFRGEVITSIEFIDVIKAYMIEIEKKQQGI